jgi:polyhydroxyalkanoate synthesis regulator phasin
MKKEEVVEIMIYTVNNYNIEGAEKAGMSYDQIQNMVDTLRPGLLHMFGLIYDDLVKKGAITQN